MSAARVWTLALAFLFLAGHLPFLAPSLEDIDSLNFALGLRDFDPTRHQPHPPGYPLFIALGKLARAAGLSEAHALAVWGAVLGALAIVALVRLFRAVDGVDRLTPDASASLTARLATILTVVCPLFWFTAVRPMSDVPGLAMALCAQALLASALWRQREMTAHDRAGLMASGRLIVLGSFVAALALGFRSQTIWLTAPVLMLVIVHRTGRGAAGAILGASIAFAIGTLMWALPMMVASGGVAAYVGALRAQAAEDFSGVDMLISDPTVRNAAGALMRTLIAPWDSMALGVVVLSLSLVGMAVMLARARMGLLLLAALAVPYAALDLLFQETMTTRYALPLVPVICYLAIRGLSVVGRRGTVAAAAVLGLWAAGHGVPAVSAYASAPSPVFQALNDVASASRAESMEPVLSMHYAFVRALEVAPPAGVREISVIPKHEWLATASHLRTAERAAVWFLADPMRTDLALFDPSARRIRGRYRWPAALNTLLSGVRPSPVDWIEIKDPGWFLEEGWALTPETAGMIQLEGARSSRPSPLGVVRRRDDACVLLIGGRNLDPGVVGPVRVAIRIDDREVGSVIAPPYPGFFVHLLTLPAGTLAGPGRYGMLSVVTARNDPQHVDRGVAADIAIEQFNLQASDKVVWGFDSGWQEQEFNPATGRLWRWTSDRATTRVHHGHRDLTLTIAGESPLRYFDRPARVTVRAGDRLLARHELSTDFEFKVRVPSETLAAANDHVTIETDETFVPAERGASGDRRKLGLRIWRFELEEASPSSFPRQTQH